MAHHNLGSFEESLKFLEASRHNLLEISRLEAEAARRRQVLARQSLAATSTNTGAAVSGTATVPPPAENSSSIVADKPSIEDPAVVTDPALIALLSRPIEARVPLDLDMYITVCMGNVYQSSGDDEQALLQYTRGWRVAKSYGEEDWAAVLLNSIGLVCYYSLRYELAYQCFTTVASYRAKVSGIYYYYLLMQFTLCVFYYCSTPYFLHLL